MAIKKVWLDESEDECTSCGLCEGIAPEVFEVPDKMIVKEDVNFSDYEDEIRDAAESCPTEVIKFEEE
ncbi:MAG: ferredoxin [Bacteroidetes bacterium]|nr:ferredoxin [Bacteroidota bacterium]MBU1578698.1 ferredoxin [Bacteroidota bacterium]MBU2465151.1 ferredoxin [Bacteroidota bacterium]MBU2557897.1 ferredoxin [Bacteroidota bacterium]